MTKTVLKRVVVGREPAMEFRPEFPSYENKTKPIRGVCAGHVTHRKRQAYVAPRVRQRKSPLTVVGAESLIPVPLE